MTTLDHVIATHQSEWVSFNEEPLFPIPSEGGPKEHVPGASSSSDQSESSSGEHHVLDGGSQDLSHSEHDDSSEKLGLISEAASPPGSPERRPPDLVSAISSWVQFEDDAPWASSSPPPKEAGGTGDHRSPSMQQRALEAPSMGFPGGSDGEGSACHAGDMGSIPGSGRSPGGGTGDPLQYSCLENPTDRGAWQAAVHGVAKRSNPTELTDRGAPGGVLISYLLYPQ